MTSWLSCTQRQCEQETDSMVIGLQIRCIPVSMPFFWLGNITLKSCLFPKNHFGKTENNKLPVRWKYARDHLRARKSCFKTYLKTCNECTPVHWKLADMQWKCTMYWLEGFICIINYIISNSEVREQWGGEEKVLHRQVRRKLTCGE